MNRAQLEALLEEVGAGRLEPAAALERLIHFPSEDLDFARLDHHRALRQGLPEVVFCAGKTTEQVVAICEGLVRQSGGFLGTRASEGQAQALRERFPECRWNALARTIVLPARRLPDITGAPLLVVAAGTSDLPVSEEAVEVALACGLTVERLTDVGVAGLHRLLSASDALHRAAAIIVVAGME